MTTLPFVTSDWRRETAQEPSLKVQNRFFEENPSNFAEGSSLILRPAIVKYETESSTVSPYLFRSLYQNQGIFDDAYFTLYDQEVRKTSYSGFSTQIAKPGIGFDINDWQTTSSNTNHGAFVQEIGNNPGYFYFTNGSVLFVYPENTFFIGTLTVSGPIENNATVIIGGVYYKFTTGPTNVGPQDGTSTNPWLVAGVGTSGLTNLDLAVRGISDFPGIQPNPAVTVGGYGYPINVMVVRSKIGGITGSSITTSVSGTAVLSWAAGTLTLGPDIAYRVWMPESAPAISIISFNSYLIISSDKGRLFWIEPGETTVEPLNFATAESLPDSIVSLRSLGDIFAVMGNSSVEFWSGTGNALNPFQKSPGRTLTVGALNGGDTVIDNKLIFVGSDYTVYLVDGSQLTPISTPAISELVREYLLTKPNLLQAPSSFRAWPLVVDDHMFYVLSLGQSYTKVYDLKTGRWSSWTTGDEGYWYPHCGTPISTEPQYPVLTGNINSGHLYWVSPEAGLDDTDDPLVYAAIQSIVTCGLPMRMRDTLNNYSVFLSGSVNQPAVESFLLTDAPDTPFLTDNVDETIYLVETSVPLVNAYVFAPYRVRLEYSDDNGHTWTIADEDRSVILQGYNTELGWYSLGQIAAPGRLYRFTDYGALKRLDGVDIEVND